MKTQKEIFRNFLNIVTPKGAELEDIQIRTHFNKPGGLKADIVIKFNKKEQCHVDMWLRANAKSIIGIETVDLGYETNPFNEVHEYLKTTYTFLFKD